jgi:hypothetical protein
VRVRRSLDAEHLTGVDVAEAGRGVGGLDAQGHHVAVLGGEHRLAHRLGEGGLVGDQVVGGERADDGVRLLGGDHGGGQPDRRGRVAGRGLGQQVVGRQLGQLPGDRGGMGLTGDHEHLVGTRQRLEPVPGLLQQGAPRAGEVEQELGGPRPRQRPQPGAGPTGRHDHP